MTTQLREELTALADTQTFSPDPAAWDRGRRARRNARVIRVAAVAAVVAIVVGVGAVSLAPDREAPQPAGEVRGGAIPSRIPVTKQDFLTDLAIGKASIAYVDENSMPVLVDASTGEAHRTVLPDFPTQQAFRLTRDLRRGSWLALSPDGLRLAYPTVAVQDDGTGRRSFITAWYRVVDLTSGTSELVALPPGTGTPLAMSWTADGRIAVDVLGTPTRRVTKANTPPAVGWTVDPATGDASTSPLTGIVAPGGGISAVLPRESDLVDAVQFQTSSDTDPVSVLPTDRYPEGAVVQPLGWVEPDVLVAWIDPPPSKVTEPPRLALVASPERPGSDVDFREFLPRLPPALSMSIAVDLIPDLTGDPDQELTHDFSATSPADEDPDRLPYALGGLAALAAGLAFVRMMQKRA
ncbi:hypothetical protein J2X46_003669 [Nocardioides sp. BE266]|uniref:hypothetical protein n=1 Tax=Nocardioides sp. BE266 TaxID=2817725 RepID=UPI00285A66B1|nr:hypothetical protein [Nocardioides sp. BE266]MDR7254671.1 hypothetical protein [Nocardioides sp. BE266]